MMWGQPKVLQLPANEMGSEIQRGWKSLADELRTPNQGVDNFDKFYRIRELFEPAAEPVNYNKKPTRPCPQPNLSLIHI